MIWIIATVFFSMASFLPLLDSQHWIIRIFDFIRLQLLAILFLLLITRFFFVENINSLEISVVLLLLLAISYHLKIVFPYIPKFKKRLNSSAGNISLLSINVMQKNKAFDKVKNTIQASDPDILFTMESDHRWEKGLATIEDNFKTIVRVPKDNRYGIHFYTKLEVKDYKVHYLISDEHPSIEARLLDKNNNEFIFWGIHPPPPSPTEKPTSKQKDAELMKVAKLISDIDLPVIVAGDFNNVCWSKVSKKFGKISKLKDARINRGFYGTFPAGLSLLRFPIDLLFHSESVVIDKLEVLPPVGSDHLPLLSKFDIRSFSVESKNNISPELETEMNKIIKEGKKAAESEN